MDFLLDSGDFSIKKSDNDSTYDITLEDTTQTIKKLIRRTIETPLRYIARYINSNQVIEEIDADYGNPIYKKLAEPLSSSFLMEMKADLTSCLSKIQSIEGLRIISITITSFSFESIDLQVDYAIDNNNLNTSISFNL